MLRKSFYYISFVFILIFLNVSCSSPPQESKKKLEYVDNVEIELMLAPSLDLINIDREDIFFTIRNNGNRNITRLHGDVVFYNSNDEEVGRTGWYFINVSETLERIASPDKKVKHRPLLPGDSLKLGADVVYFFAGEPQVRRKVKESWDDLRAKAIKDSISWCILSRYMSLRNNRC